MSQRKRRSPLVRYLDNQIREFDNRSASKRIRKGIVAEKQSILKDALEGIVYEGAELPWEMAVELFVAFSELTEANHAPDLFVAQESQGGRQSFIVQEYIRAAVEFIRVVERGRLPSLGRGSAGLKNAKRLVIQHYGVDKNTPKNWLDQHEGIEFRKSPLKPTQIRRNMESFGKRYQRERLNVRRKK